MKPRPRSHCPISLGLDAIGDKWSLLILRDLILRGKQRYRDFLESEEGISTNILADRLFRLEQRGLISKANDPDNKRQFRYSPTRKGLDLLPVLRELTRWSVKHDPYVNKEIPYLQRMKVGEKELMRELASTLARVPSK